MNLEREPFSEKMCSSSSSCSGEIFSVECRRRLNVIHLGIEPGRFVRQLKTQDDVSIADQRFQGRIRDREPPASGSIDLRVQTSAAVPVDRRCFECPHANCAAIKTTAKLRIRKVHLTG